MACIGLISCVGQKKSHAEYARLLYVSPLFKKSRDFVESHCDSWYILSAKYGLVSPLQTISPYDESLKSKTRAKRKQWSDDVWAGLGTLLKPEDRVIVLAGERYREFLIPRIVEHGCRVEAPMSGLRIGLQLKWLTEQMRHHEA